MSILTRTLGRRRRGRGTRVTADVAQPLGAHAGTSTMQKHYLWSFAPNHLPPNGIPNSCAACRHWISVLRSLPGLQWVPFAVIEKSVPCTCRWQTGGRQLQTDVATNVPLRLATTHLETHSGHAAVSGRGPHRPGHTQPELASPLLCLEVAVVPQHATEHAAGQAGIVWPPLQKGVRVTETQGLGQVRRCWTGCMCPHRSFSLLCRANHRVASSHPSCCRQRDTILPLTSSASGRFSACRCLGIWRMQ